MKIAFIGLGNMGGPMAANLVKAGHEVTGFDVAARPEGLTMAASAAEAARGAEVVITMLPNGAILRSIAAEVIPSMAPGAVLCDCSTVDVDSARAVAEHLVERIEAARRGDPAAVRRVGDDDAKFPVNPQLAHIFHLKLNVVGDARFGGVAAGDLDAGRVAVAALQLQTAAG